MTTRTNKDRADDVHALIEAFAKDAGLVGEDDETIAGDFICNILHWVHQRAGEDEFRVAALTAARYGLAHFTTEASIDYSAEDVDELGPEATVLIKVACDGKQWESLSGSDGLSML